MFGVLEGFAAATRQAYAARSRCRRGMSCAPGGAGRTMGYMIIMGVPRLHKASYRSTLHISTAAARVACLGYAASADGADWRRPQRTAKRGLQ